MAPEDHLLVQFGETGDLAKRKLLPGWRGPEGVDERVAPHRWHLPYAEAGHGR